MAENVETLRGLFFPVETDLSAESQKTLDASEKLRELRRKLETQSRGIRWPDTFQQIGGKLGELTDVRILEDIFIKVWNKARLFQKYLDPDKYPANETIEIPLLEHTVTSTHRPYIEVRFNETLIDRIDFEVTVTLELKGAVLEIQGGKITKLQSGECKGKGELRCEGLLLASEDFKPIKLPGTKEFDGGISISA
jgi:hypothetical protein